jgi:hypothetical protein
MGPGEKKDVARRFLEEVMPDIEPIIDRAYLSEVKTADTPEQREEAFYSLRAVARVKTAIRQFTTNDQ